MGRGTQSPKIEHMLQQGALPPKTGKKTNYKHTFEYCSEPSEKKRKRESRRGDIACGAIHTEELETRRHDEDPGEYQPAKDYSYRLPQRY
jgi:hypothetical protein